MTIIAQAWVETGRRETVGAVGGLEDGREALAQRSLVFLEGGK